MSRDACWTAQECRGDPACRFLSESEACQALAERTAAIVAWDVDFAGVVVVLDGCQHWLQVEPADGPGDRERWCTACGTVRPVAAEIVAWETAADWSAVAEYARGRLDKVQADGS